MSEDISRLNKAAVELLLSFPTSTKVRVISHYDADGISAAGILCKALYRAGFDFHATLMRNPFNKGLERLAKEKNDIILFSDMGSAQLKSIEEMGSSCIILDHHQYLTKETKDNVIQVNANRCGIDGNYEACGASLCFSFAQTLDEYNSDLCYLGLTGAIGDKQHIGGLKGFNKKILDAALKNDVIEERVGIKLYGDSISDALYYAADPFYSGLSGNNDAIASLLKKIGIDPDLSVEHITGDALKKLQSYLFYVLLRKGCQQNILDTVIRKRYFSKVLGCELERFADLLDACGKFGYRDIGLSLCLGDYSLFKKAFTIEKKYKQKILSALIELEHGGIKELDAMRYFYSDSSSLGGVVAGIAGNYIFDVKKPLFSLGRKKDEIHISCRGNQLLVQNGLDLGDALKKVTVEIGGFGGGHKIAAGATISLEKEKEFIEKVNSILTLQIKG
ncbi:MAG: DHH family phosphoesterase [Thermoplasmatota archaeon]